MQCKCNIYVYMYMMQCPHQQCLIDAQKRFRLLAMLFAKHTNKKLGQNKYVYVNSVSHMPPNTVAPPVVIQELRSPCSKRTIPIFPPNMLVKLTQAKHHWYTGGKDLQCFLLPAADVLLS